MSEPMGCSENMSYGQEGGILETVSEESRRHTGKNAFILSLDGDSENWKKLISQVWIIQIYPITTSVTRSSIHQPKVVWQMALRTFEWDQIVCITILPIIYHLIIKHWSHQTHRLWSINRMPQTTQEIMPNNLLWSKLLYHHLYLLL